MNPLQHLFSNSKPKEQQVETEADKVMFYVKSLVNREDLIDELIKKYTEARLLPQANQISAYIPIYIGLEAFIIRNKPLIVKQEFTKDALRETIRKQFDIQSLNPSFRLLFLPDAQQNTLLYEQGALQLSYYIMSNLGLPHLNAAIAALEQEQIKNIITVNERGMVFNSAETALANVSDAQVRLLFQGLYKALFTEITKSVGSRTSEKVITDIFDDIKATYDFDIIAKFLDVLPEGVLESERIRRLGRDELENKIQSRTRELDEARKQVEQKLNLIKQQNDELAKAKEALTKSLQEEKRLEEEIKKEKEQVEEKVKERTAQLEQKTNELNNTMTSLQLSYQQTENEKARLLASINNLSLGFVMTDSDDKIIAINKTSYQILHCEGREFSALQELHDFLKGSVNLNEYYQKSKKEKAMQKTSDITFGNIFLRFFFTPILINNNCIGVVILLEDISEAKLLERSKDEFFAVASHELRTPLTAIRGFTSLIMANFGDLLQQDKRLPPMIANIHQSSIRLIKIVNNFLDASKLEQGKISFNLQTFVMEPLIDGVVLELSQLATEKNIYLKFDKKEEKMPEVYADEERVKHVVINLVGNAIKFTEKGGITIWMEKDFGYVKVFVKDTGLGVSEEYRQLLFKKFQQAGERILTRDAATGSGMGLYISKLLIEAMNGTIAIENTKLGEGATFSFTLPIANKEGI